MSNYATPKLIYNSNALSNFLLQASQSNFAPSNALAAVSNTAYYASNATVGFSNDICPLVSATLDMSYQVSVSAESFSNWAAPQILSTSNTCFPMSNAFYTHNHDQRYASSVHTHPEYALASQVSLGVMTQKTTGTVTASQTGYVYIRYSNANSGLPATSNLTVASTTGQIVIQPGLYQVLVQISRSSASVGAWVGYLLADQRLGMPQVWYSKQFAPNLNVPEFIASDPALAPNYACAIAQIQAAAVDASFSVSLTKVG